MEQEYASAQSTPPVVFRNQYISAFDSSSSDEDENLIQYEIRQADQPATAPANQRPVLPATEESPSRSECQADQSVPAPDSQELEYVTTEGIIAWLEAITFDEEIDFAVTDYIITWLEAVPLQEDLEDPFMTPEGDWDDTSSSSSVDADSQSTQ